MKCMQEKTLCFLKVIFWFWKHWYRCSCCIYYIVKIVSFTQSNRETYLSQCRKLESHYRILIAQQIRWLLLLDDLNNSSNNNTVIDYVSNLIIKVWWKLSINQIMKRQQNNQIQWNSYEYIIVFFFWLLLQKKSLSRKRKSKTRAIKFFSTTWSWGRH